MTEKARMAKISDNLALSASCSLPHAPLHMPVQILERKAPAAFARPSRQRRLRVRLRQLLAVGSFRLFRSA